MPFESISIFYSNNLEKIEKLIWDLFEQGTKNRKSSFHYPTIATKGNKTFNLRTVILRKVLRKRHTIIFYTDFRSNKVKELEFDNQLALHVYDKKNSIQIQLEGVSEILNKDKMNKEIWNSMPKYSKSIYLTKKAPGTIISHDQETIEYLNDAKGYENFTIVKVKIKKIIFLQLSKEINRKALIKYGSNRNEYSWVIP